MLDIYKMTNKFNPVSVFCGLFSQFNYLNHFTAISYFNCN